MQKSDKIRLLKNIFKNKIFIDYVPVFPKHCLFFLPACLSELEELLQALKWMQNCLHDAQSQQDVELIMQLLAKEEFRKAYMIYSAVSQQLSRASPTSPLTSQAQDLCQQVHLGYRVFHIRIS